jgi:photosystem II stability/assembly factor-like uncharacterized protein
MKYALFAILSVFLVSGASAQTQCEGEAYGCPDMASFMARLNHTQQNTTVPVPPPAHIEPRSMTQADGVLYLGTSAGAIYTSHDNGLTWQGLTKFRPDYVIDRIAVDGKRIYVAAWLMGDPSDGAFLRSLDSGASWQLTSRKVFRGLTTEFGCIYRACTGKMIYAGGPDGVYLSTNEGYSFEKISSAEIKDVQSIAVNDGSIYIGTWHLGWYSHNNGMSWHHIDKGIINDSDFFSIVLDGSTVYVGACSGIYKGNDDGEQYHKEKTKTDARRTKVIRQVSHDTLYAGTTDGVWITTDGGKNWKRRGNRNIVVNDMVATSPNHLVVATSRFGVIWSDDGGKSFTQAQF